MRTYNTQHSFYCGVDLHARTLYIHVLDHAGKTRIEPSPWRTRSLNGPRVFERALNGEEMGSV